MNISHVSTSSDQWFPNRISTSGVVEIHWPLVRPIACVYVMISIKCVINFSSTQKSEIIWILVQLLHPSLKVKEGLTTEALVLCIQRQLSLNRWVWHKTCPAQTVSQLVNLTCCELGLHKCASQHRTPFYVLILCSISTIIVKLS